MSLLDKYGGATKLGSNELHFDASADISAALSGKVRESSKMPPVQKQSKKEAEKTGRRSSRKYSKGPSKGSRGNDPDLTAAVAGISMPEGQQGLECSF